MARRALQVATVLLVTVGLATCAHRATRSGPAPPGPATAAQPALEPAPAPPTPAEGVAAATPAPGPERVVLSPTLGGDEAFGSRVRPILERRCSPCHFTGGRMYGRLPFDSPDAVRSRPEGILRRLKVAEEHQVVEDWLHTGSD